MIARRLALAITLAAAVGAGPAAAAEPGSPQAGITGQDAMGDKGRSGPDGWSWAPVTRDQAPAGTPPGGNGTQAARSAPNAQPGGQRSTPMPPGQDPGAPAAQAPPGPGTSDVPAKTR